MSNHDDLLEVLQADIHAVLKNTPALALANILLVDEETTDSKVADAVKTLTATNGKRGLAVLVLRPEITRGESNLPGPPLTIRIQVQVVEQVLLNRAADGTQVRCSAAALNVLATLQLMHLGNCLVYTDKDPLKPEQVKTGYVSDVVTVYTQFSGLVTARPLAVSAELTTIAATPEGQIRFQAPLLDLDLLLIPAGTFGGKPFWSKTGSQTPAAGPWWTLGRVPIGPSGKWAFSYYVDGTDIGAGTQSALSDDGANIEILEALWPDGETVTEVEPVAAGDYLTLDCPSEDSAIYYTTDGSYPTPEKTLYTAPFTAPATGTVIRAAAYVTGQAPGDVLEFTVTE